MEPVTKFTYLGSDIDSDRYSIVQIHRRLGLVNSIMVQLDGFGNSKNSVWPLSYVSCLHSSCLFSCMRLKPGLWERWTVTPQQQILGIKWFNHVKNTAVSEKTGLKDLPLIIADRRHSLFGHICRLSPEVPVHRALELCIDASSGISAASDWRCSPGWPCRTWLKHWRRTWSNLRVQLGLQP